MYRIYLIFIFIVMLSSCNNKAEKKELSFITTQKGQFIKGENPYYFVGTNYWYGGILGSEGRGGNRDRLIEELDLMKAHGINNLRVLAGAEGPDYEPYRVTPALQIEPGVYNDTLLTGLDFFMNELSKRDMYAILYLNNTWEWSGGYGQYLVWNGYGEFPYPQISEGGWPGFTKFASQFHSCETCMQQYRDHIKFMLSRTNQFNGRKYTEDPNIMTWEIANEPRALSNDNKEPFAKWIKETADFIKSLDSTHLVTTGTEGSHGCEKDMDLFKQIHSYQSIDYLTMHIWPKNWRWLDCERITETVDSAIVLASEYMQNHIEVARSLQKPIVFEEFGLPRDNHTFSLDDRTTARDKYYGFAFDMVEKHTKNKDVLAGTNFWAFGGTGRHYGEDPMWKPGDDLMGDPPQEEQGLNSVFDTDSTMQVIKAHAKRLEEISGQ